MTLITPPTLFPPLLLVKLAELLKLDSLARHLGAAQGASAYGAAGWCGLIEALFAYLHKHARLLDATREAAQHRTYRFVFPSSYFNHNKNDKLQMLNDK
ncbi:MAG: hypothetical protein U1A26_00565 [Candidatus Sungbacteria bacterium]|nr:hypothetical protein [Candidatus Sungbacteria bacterium]